jgi:hypothetical protein
MDPLPEGLIPVARGEVVALPDPDPGETVEYGIVKDVVIDAGVVYLDLEVYDSSCRPPAEDASRDLRRVPFLGGIQ